jgi:NAD(P)-dependent dehydrogenase (short-subunit alcohol dehydrogenase family)
MSRTAVITGGAGGLGRALATALQAEGWFTVLIDLPGDALDDCGDTAQQRAYGCDLTNAKQLTATCAQICVDSPSIDLVIYNAGVTQIMAFDQVSMASHRRLFEINYFAAVACAQAFLHPLRQSKGTHLAISSVAGFSPLLHRTAYSASKHALEGFFKSLRSEENQYGVRTVIAAPSFVATNTGNAQADAAGLARPGSASDGVDVMTAAEAAQTIVSGLRNRREFIPVGRVARLASLMNRLSPQYFQKMMEKKMAKQD